MNSRFRRDHVAHSIVLETNHRVGNFIQSRERVLRQRQNARYDAVVDSAPDAILTLDTKAAIVLANSAAIEAFGYSLAELMELPAASLFDDQPAWHNAWRSVAVNQHLSTLQAVRLFAMLSTASSDAMIGCWDSKYTYAFWRPVTAIRAGGGNPRLHADPNWIGLVITPNHPEYPAAHGCFSGAVVATLQAYFETDQLSFQMSSPAPGLVQAVRQYDRLSQALEDILNSRIYGGMHYRNSVRQGAALGQQVARQVVERFFLPRCACNQNSKAR